VIDKEKLLKAVSVMLTAIGLTWSVTTKIGEVAASLDRRLDKLEQAAVELRAEVRLLDRAAHRPGVR
jgi:prefoldin subunit 5